MTNEHPFTPPPELVLQLIELPLSEEERLVAAYLAGADHQLNACCGFIGSYHSVAWSDKLRAACRPKPPRKPPSDKEQSIALINKIQANKEMWQTEELDVVLRALEALPDSP